MDGEVPLITLYEFICKHYREQLWVYCQRFSPLVDLTFTDEEVLCSYQPFKGAPTYLRRFISNLAVA